MRACSFLLTVGCILGAVWGLARYALRFVWALLLPKIVLAARVLAAESQLAVELNRPGGGKKRRRQFTPAFRMLWVMLSKLLQGWEELAHLASDEARDGETLAHDRLPLILALALPAGAAADSQ